MVNINKSLISRVYKSTQNYYKTENNVKDNLQKTTYN